MKTAAIVQRLPSARKIWLNISWLGLTVGFVLALIGLSGSAGFLRAADADGARHRVEGPTPDRSDIDGWIAAARRAYPRSADRCRSALARRSAVPKWRI